MPPKAARTPAKSRPLKNPKRAAKCEAKKLIKAEANSSIKDNADNERKGVILGTADTSSNAPYDNAMDNTADVSSIVTATPAKRVGPSMQLKAIKAREKALVDKFAVVKGKIQNQLERDDGVVVDCFYNADEKNAPVSTRNRVRNNRC